MDKTDELGYKAWDVYYDQLEALFEHRSGRKQYNGHRYQKAFRKIGEICIENDFNIVEYVEHALMLLTKNHEYIVPSDLCNAKIVSKYLQHKEAYGNSIERSWIVQTSQLIDMAYRTVPELYEDEEAILMSLQLSFTAWFRVLYLVPFSLALCERYGHNAWLELSKSARLRKFVKAHRKDNYQKLQEQIGYFVTERGIENGTG